MSGNENGSGRAGGAPLLDYALNTAFVLVFVWLAVNNVLLRRQVADMQREMIRARRALSSTAFQRGDRLDSLRLVDLRGAEQLFDLKNAAVPSLFAVIDPGCSSCEELAASAGRAARENRAVTTRLIALGDRDAARSLAQRIGEESPVFQLPPDTPAALKQKLLAAPQAFVVAPRGLVIATCERLDDCLRQVR